MCMCMCMCMYVYVYVSTVVNFLTSWGKFGQSLDSNLRILIILRVWGLRLLWVSNFNWLWLFCFVHSLYDSWKSAAVTVAIAFCSEWLVVYPIGKAITVEFILGCVRVTFSFVLLSRSQVCLASKLFMSLGPSCGGIIVLVVPREEGHPSQ